MQTTIRQKKLPTRVVNTIYKKKLPTRKAATTTVTKVFNDNTKNIELIEQQVKKMKIGQRGPRLMNSDSSYLDAILSPENCMNAKVSGLTDATVSIKRKVTLNLTSNALGALGIIWAPYSLAETSSALSTLGVNAGIAYDGISILSTGFVATAMPQNISNTSVQGYRLVSASMHVVPQASVLNQAGSIHACLTKLTSIAPTSNTSPIIFDVGSGFVPFIENTPYYNCASISNMEGIRVIWVPNDPCTLEFAKINTNLANQGASDESVNACIAIVQGAPSANFRVDLYQNFEVIPQFGSILQGMETISPYNILATSIWREILVNHKHAITFAGRAVTEASNTPAQKISDVIPALYNTATNRVKKQYIS